MIKRLLVLPLLLCVVLSGCGKKEEEVEDSSEVQPAHEIMESTVWNNMEFDSITPVTSFETLEDDLMIYPYNDSDKYVKVEIISISDNNIWESITNIYKDGDDYHDGEKYSYVTTKDGVTRGYIPIDSESAYLLTTDCPSSYLRRVCESICKKLETIQQPADSTEETSSS